jgi:pimeloyl-ACP methyl ester carboxylesterase
MWDPLVPELEQYFRVIRYDRRGFGESSGLPSLIDDVADLRAVLDRVEASAVVLLGMSQAARIAVEAAARALPDRVLALILDGAPPGLSAATAGSDIDIRHFRDLVARRGVGAFRREWGRHPCMRLYRAGDAERALLREILAATPALDLIHNPGPTAGLSSSSEFLGKISAPVLLINGEHDSWHRRQSSLDISNALKAVHRRLVIKGAGHLAAIDCPGDYGAAIKSFVASLAGCSTALDGGNPSLLERQ